MKSSISIHPTGMTYIRKDLVSDGYKGRVEMVANAVTLTLIKPRTSLQDVKKSLEITIQDIELRIKQEEKVEVTG